MHGISQGGLQEWFMSAEYEHEHELAALNYLFLCHQGHLTLRMDSLRVNKEQAGYGTGEVAR